MKTKLMTLALVLGQAAPALAAAAANPDAQFFKSLAAPAASEAPAAPNAQVSSVVREQTTLVPVALNARTVKCSAADYQAPMLKVLVPELAQLTVLNHRNAREGAPCLAAGRCGEAAGPEDILKGGEGVEKVPVKVVLTKLAETDGAACRVTLVETVSTTIRGVRFFHERRQAVAERVAADCR